MNNAEANTPLGIASRGLAFALVEQIAGQDWRDRDVDKLQICLFHYGNAISEQIKNGQ
jgi:hypothetical protein